MKEKKSLSELPESLLHGYSRSWIVLAVLAAASRIPLIFNGYGSDTDSWRNIVAALRMREVGHYIPSRVPGFPVFETLMALLAPGGWIATNLAAIIFGLIAAGLFALIMFQLKIKHPLWPWLAFAFGTPLLVTTSQTMDYSFGLAFFLACYLFLLRRHYITAGILLALATGCRPTYVLINIPVLAFLLARRENWRQYLAFAAGYIPLTTALFIPVITSPEAQGLYDHFVNHAGNKNIDSFNLSIILRGPAIFLLGKLGTIVFGISLIGIISIKLRKGLYRLKEWIFRINTSTEVVLFEIGTILVIGFFYVLIPYQRDYLLPILPLFLIILARRLPRPWLIIVSTAILASTFISINFSQRNFVGGSFFREINERREDMAETRDLASRNPDHPTVYVVGRFNIHRLLVLNPELERTPAAWAPFGSPGIALRNKDKGVAYASHLKPEQRERLKNKGWNIR